MFDASSHSTLQNLNSILHVLEIQWFQNLPVANENTYLFVVVENFILLVLLLVIKIDAFHFNPRLTKKINNTFIQINSDRFVKLLPKR